MDESHVVTCFLRNRAAVLLLRRSERVGSYVGQWGGVAGYAEGAPDEQARHEIAEETGLETHVSLVRAGDPLSVEDEDLGTRWVVHPYLFDCDSRAVELNEETTEYDWVSPVEIRHRETVPDLWTAYERVAPTVECVVNDREHGSDYLSIRALEVLRDRAVRERDEDATKLPALARRLRDARPSMTVIENRVNRLMFEQSDANSVSTTEREIERAIAGRNDAAAAAADRLTDQSVLTLSRSGTVRETLEQHDSTVYITESIPGGEGVALAESLAPTTDVTLLPDSTIAHALSTTVDAVLVGADTVLVDGSVVNKVGTRGTALAAAHENVPVYAVASADKIDATTNTNTNTNIDLEPNEPSAVYEGDADLAVLAPTFDVTPAEHVTVITEHGTQSTADLERIADRHRTHAEWDL